MCMKTEKISNLLLLFSGIGMIFISVVQLWAGAGNIFILGIMGGVATIYGSYAWHELLK